MALFFFFLNFLKLETLKGQDYRKKKKKILDSYKLTWYKRRRMGYSRDKRRRQVVGYHMVLEFQILEIVAGEASGDHGGTSRSC